MPKYTHDVVTIGGAVRDISFFNLAGQVIATPHNLTAQKMLAFEYGAKFSVKDACFHFGGGASNVAVSLRRLGYRTAIFCRVGKDEVGREVLQRFTKEKVATQGVQFDPILRTGFSVVLSTDRKDREHVVLLYRGANEHLVLTSAQLGRVQPRCWYISSLGGAHWQKNLELVFAQKRRGGGMVAWNPGSMQLKAGRRVLAPFLQHTDVLTLNKDEAIELVLSGITLGKRNPKFVNDTTYLLHMLHDWGARIVVITMGQKGAWAFDGKQVYRQPVLRSKVVDTTGVGDAFGSSFLGGLLSSQFDIALALRWGAVNAASVVTKEGAQNGLLKRAELEVKLRRKK